MHLPLSPPCRPMRVLGAIVQIPALSVFDAGKQIALRDAAASRLVGHDHLRHILQSLRQSSEDTVGSVGITPILNQTVERDAVWSTARQRSCCTPRIRMKTSSRYHLSPGRGAGGWPTSGRISCTSAARSHSRRRCPDGRGDPRRRAPPAPGRPARRPQAEAEHVM